LGDARATDAGRSRGEWNVGQLLREKFGMEKTFNIGFSTFKGSVTAAKSWDKPGLFDQVRSGLLGSYEHVLHAASVISGNADYGLIFRSNNSNVKIDQQLVQEMAKPRLERYIGVIYRPDTERASHYCKSSLSQEYDAVVYIDETRALQPIDRSVPWEKGRDNFISDTDSHPEIDERTVISDDDDVNWRIAVGADVNRAGCELMTEGHLEDAAMKFDKALRYVEHQIHRYNHSENIMDMRVEIMLNRAECNFQLKAWTAVVKDCSTILSLRPNNTQGHLLIGRAYEEKGQAKTARYHFDFASKIAAQRPHLVTPNLNFNANVF